MENGSEVFSEPSSIQEFRDNAEKIVLKKWPSLKEDENNFRFNVETTTLETINKDILTVELLKNSLVVFEEYWREELNKELAEDISGEKSDMVFNIWSKCQDALKGATGEGSVSDTIDYFRERAASRRRVVNSVENQLFGEAPLRDASNILRYIQGINNALPEHKKAAENYDAAARLFENQLELHVPESE